MATIPEGKEYEPLFPRLALHLYKPFAELPEELKPLVASAFFAAPWDEWPPDQRVRVAREYDAQQDPLSEESLHVEFRLLLNDFDQRISEAKANDSVGEALLKLRADITAILDGDRERVAAVRRKRRTDPDESESTNAPSQAPPATSQSDLTCMRGLALMAWILAENTLGMKSGTHPNAAAIGNKVRERAKRFFGKDVRGFDAFHKKISSALAELKTESETEN
jgi:hypothetical protein